MIVRNKSPPRLGARHILKHQICSPNMWLEYTKGHTGTFIIAVGIYFGWRKRTYFSYLDGYGIKMIYWVFEFLTASSSRSLITIFLSARLLFLILIWTFISLDFRFLIGLFFHLLFYFWVLLLVLILFYFIYWFLSSLYVAIFFPL